MTLWSIKWSHDRWHHVTPKVLWGSRVGYHSDSLASCFVQRRVSMSILREVKFGIGYERSHSPCHSGEWRWRRRSVKWTASQCAGLIWAMCRRGKWMRIKRTGSRIQSPHRHSLISQMNFILPARPVANRLLFPAAFARRTLNVAGACLL